MALGDWRFRADGRNHRRRASPVLAWRCGRDRVCGGLDHGGAWRSASGFTDTFMSIANHTIGAETLWRIVFAGFTLVGRYLTYVGWFSRHKGSVAQAPGSIPDLPRAA